MSKKAQKRSGNQSQRQSSARAARSTDDWCCKLCCGQDGQAYRNHGHRTSCHKCQVAKGASFLCKVGDAHGQGPGPGSASPSSSKADRERHAGLEKSNRELREKLAAKERELTDLTARGKLEGEAGCRVEAKVEAASAELPAAKALHRQIQQLKGLDPVLRDSLCAHRGGSEAVLRDLEVRHEAECAKQREQRPLAQQKSSAEAHLKRMQRAKTEAANKLEQMQAAQAELAAKIASQTNAVAEADSKLQKARLEVVAITEKATAELRGTSHSCSAVTVSAVTGWFGKLPTEVVEHPQAQEAMQKIMSLIGKLDTAKQVVEAGSAQPVRPESAAAPEASAAASAASLSATVCEEMDDDLLDALAVAATGGDEEAEDEDGAAKAQRIAAAKARLRAKRGELAKKMVLKKTVKQ